MPCLLLDADHVHEEAAEPSPLSDRASGVLEEVVKVSGRVRADYRRAVSGRHVMTFQFQGWYLGAAEQLCEQLAPLLSNKPDAVERWLKQPFVGDWPFPLSCKGRDLVKPPAKEGGTWSSRPQRVQRDLCKVGVRPRVVPPAVAMWFW